MDPNKYLGKYRNKSVRDNGWNYASPGNYFVTICTKNRTPFFGEIKNGINHLSEIGEIARIEWINSPVIRRDMNLTMDTFVIMPNHVHGIITIGYNQYNSFVDIAGDGRILMHQNPTITTAQKGYKNEYGSQSKNLASIIRGFKSSVTMQARRIDPDFTWQAKYHDVIIRDDLSFDRIKKYIESNVRNWESDENYVAV